MREHFDKKVNLKKIYTNLFFQLNPFEAYNRQQEKFLKINTFPITSQRGQILIEKVKKDKF